MSPLALGSSHDESETGDIGPGGSVTDSLPTVTDTDNPHPEPEKSPSDSEENKARHLTPIISPKHVINHNNKTTLSPNSLEMLTRLFPNKKRSVLELVLRRCGDDLLKAIEEIVPRDVCQNVASGSSNLQGSNALHQYLTSYKSTVTNESTKEDTRRTDTVNSARPSSSVLKSAFKPVSPSTSANISPNTSSAIGFGHHSNLNSTPEIFLGSSALLSPPTAHQSSLPFAATMSSLLALQNHQTNNSTTGRIMSSMFYPPSDLLFQTPHLPFAHSAALFTNSLSPSFYMTASNEASDQQFFNPYRNTAASSSSADLCCSVPGCDECNGDNGDSHQQGRKSYSKMSVN